MSFIDELYEDSKQSYSNEQKNEVERKISKTQVFLKDHKISKWHIVVVGFGEHLLKDQNLIYRNVNESFSVQDMKNFKGLNFGEYEFCYEHMALILSDVHHKYIENLKNIIVVPISSTKRKNSLLLEKKYNNFLLNDSYILLDSIKHVSLERINIKESKRIFKNNFRPVSPVIIDGVKDTMKKMFDIS